MCATYLQTANSPLIYTGGHDGSLISWSFETGYSKL